jgi:phosphoribosyl-ATP pyrophosphohydrolase
LVLIKEAIHARIAHSPARRRNLLLPAHQTLLADGICQLEADLARVRADPGLAPRTARLLDASVTKAGKKLAEEAVEVALDAVRGDRQAVIAETADLLYNLVVLLDRMGISSDEIGVEMHRRRAAYGIAAKCPKPVTEDA